MAGPGRAHDIPGRDALGPEQYGTSGAAAGRRSWTGNSAPRAFGPRQQPVEQRTAIGYGRSAK
jgi:hypothetical protein